MTGLVLLIVSRYNLRLKKRHFLICCLKIRRLTLGLKVLCRKALQPTRSRQLVTGS